MTRCLNLIAIAAIATTTFLSTFALDFKVELTDKDGAIHKFKVADRVCEGIPGGIIAVLGVTDADTCYLYKTSGCDFDDKDFWTLHGGDGDTDGDGNTPEAIDKYPVNYIWCAEDQDFDP
ncbi:hypothetical protein DFQ26_001089 [Actinomortierella ambigua]|nr:hypothetical protein DFQ26_001089 [Actinomortierella ambigua]